MEADLLHLLLCSEGVSDTLMARSVSQMFDRVGLHSILTVSKGSFFLYYMKVALSLHY